MKFLFPFQIFIFEHFLLVAGILFFCWEEICLRWVVNGIMGGFFILLKCSFCHNFSFIVQFGFVRNVIFLFIDKFYYIEFFKTVDELILRFLRS